MFDPTMKSKRIMQEYELLKYAVSLCIDLEPDERLTNIEYSDQSNLFTAVVLSDTDANTTLVDTTQVDGITVETILRELQNNAQNAETDSDMLDDIRNGILQ